MEKIGIIVLNYKQYKLTEDTIESILKITHKNFDYHIYIIDNNSPDDSYSKLQKKYSSSPLITIKKNSENSGYSGGNNFGIKLALKDKVNYSLIINNDVLVDKNFLQVLYDTSKRYKDNCLIGPKIYFAPGYEFHKNRYTKSQIGKVIWSAGGQIDWDNIYGSNIGVDEVDEGQRDKENYYNDFLTGCCFLVPVKIFEKIGFFDEKYFMYLEDVDFCHKAKIAGFKLVYAPESFIWHVNSGSSGSGSNLHDYFTTRNRLIFGFKYAKLRTKIALLRESLKLFLFGRKYQQIGIKDYFFKNFYKGSWK